MTINVTINLIDDHPNESLKHSHSEKTRARLYILVQQCTTVSFAALPVLRTLYKPMPMPMRLIVKLLHFVFYKNCSFKKNYLCHVLTFGQFHPKNGVIVQKLI